MDAGHRGRTTADDMAIVANRALAKAWYWSNHLAWTVELDGQIVARFADERDARGFAAARYHGDATVERRCQRRRT
jgi:hypothetical protein